MTDHLSKSSSTQNFEINTSEPTVSFRASSSNDISVECLSLYTARFPVGMGVNPKFDQFPPKSLGWSQVQTVYESCTHHCSQAKVLPEQVLLNSEGFSPWPYTGSTLEVQVVQHKAKASE